jgi:hypothetical protein
LRASRLPLVYHAPIAERGRVNHNLLLVALHEVAEDRCGVDLCCPDGAVLGCPASSTLREPSRFGLVKRPRDTTLRIVAEPFRGRS